MSFVNTHTSPNRFGVIESCRLRIAEALRCARKAVELRHADERCKLTDLHVFSLSSVIKNFNPNDRIYEFDLIT